MAHVTTARGLPRWSDHTAFARRHTRWIGVLMLVGLLAGAGWSLRQPTTYSATTSVALTAVPKYVAPSTGELLAPAVTIDTDAQLLQSPQVLGAVADALGTTPGEAMDHLSVAASPNSSVLHVTISSTSAALAADAADAAVTSLLNLRREVLGSLELEQLRQLQALLVAKEALLAKQQATELVVHPTNELFAEVLALQEGLDELQEARTRPGLVVRPAEQARSRDYPNTEVPVVSGVMLGLLAGCLVGAHRDRLRRLSPAGARTWRVGPSSPQPLIVPFTLHEESSRA